MMDFYEWLQDIKSKFRLSYKDIGEIILKDGLSVSNAFRRRSISELEQITLRRHFREKENGPIAAMIEEMIQKATLPLHKEIEVLKAEVTEFRKSALYNDIEKAQASAKESKKKSA